MSEEQKTKHIPRTPNWCINTAISISYGTHDFKTLPAGSFVRPIHIDYVPKHVIEKNPLFNPTTETYCFTRYGIVPIYTSNLRET